MRIYFKSHNLIGDALYISPAWRQWLVNHLQNNVEVFMDTLPDHVAPLYEGMIRDLLLKTGYNIQLQTVHSRPEGKFDFEHVFDVNKAFQISDKEKCHVAESYAKLLGVQIDTLKPTYIPEEEQSKEWSSDLDGEDGTLTTLKDCILISMFSNSCTSRDKNTPNLPPNKMLPWEKWISMIEYLRRTFPQTLIRFIGAPTDFVPNGYAKSITMPGEYMLGIPLNRLALIMKHAKLVVTIDNGMSHLAATQETPTFLMYPRCLGLHYILPKGNPNLVYVHCHPPQVRAEQLLQGLQYAIKRFNLTEKS